MSVASQKKKRSGKLKVWVSQTWEAENDREQIAYLFLIYGHHLLMNF
jgi:hypothetical protein